MYTNPRIEQLLKMLASEPADSFLNHALGMEYLSQGKISDARNTFGKVISENKNYLASYYQLGQTLEKLGEKEKAIECYKNGIEIAKEQNNKKAQGELSEALWMLED
jgi:tetratricopeptide (TPR) repeat protein